MKDYIRTEVLTSSRRDPLGKTKGDVDEEEGSDLDLCWRKGFRTGEVRHQVQSLYLPLILCALGQGTALFTCY